MLLSAWEVKLGCVSWRVLWAQLQSSLTTGCSCMGWVRSICVCMRLWRFHLKRDEGVHSSWIQKRKSLFHNWYLFIHSSSSFIFFNVHRYYFSSESPENCIVEKKRPHRHCNCKQVLRTSRQLSSLRTGVTITDLCGSIFCFQYSLWTSQAESPSLWSGQPPPCSGVRRDLLFL